MTSGPQLTNSLLGRAGPPGRGDFCFGERAAKEAATTASTSRFVPVTLPAAKAS
jgi:hypothetical protein